MELNIAEICNAIAKAHPARECLVFRDRSFTWAETDSRTDALAATLDALAPGRIRPFEGSANWESTQEHVALYLYNGNEYLEGMLGAYKAAWVPVNVNWRYRAEELHYVLADSRARAIVYHGRFAPLLAEVRDRLPNLELLLQVDDHSAEPLLEGALWYEDALAAAPPLRGDIELSGDDLYVCYTGGTTGRPKGVLWRQADFLVSALGIRQRSGEDWQSLDDLVAAAGRSRLRAVPAPPLMHGAAHWNALSCWIAGGTIVIQDVVDRFDAADVLDVVERRRATSLLIVGDSFALPLLEDLRRKPRDLSSLRHLLSGGAVLSPHMKEALLEAIPGITIVDVLGSSESGRQAVANTREPGETGGFRAESTATIVDEDRRGLLLPEPGRTGEIGWLTQTGRVPLGYFGDESKTRATFPVIDGVRHVVAGDRARWRADGTIELLGRESVCINTGGEKVFAEEVEVALTSHPDVTDAIVCGRASERWGNEVVGVVSLRDGATATDSELIAHVKERLAAYKAPKSIVRVTRVERSPSGKPDYAWARRVAEQAAAG